LDEISGFIISIRNAERVMQRNSLFSMLQTQHYETVSYFSICQVNVEDFIAV